MPFSHFRRSAGAALGVLALAACDLSVTNPEVQDPVDLSLDFCSNDVPVWLAYLNQEGVTTRVLPDAEGTFRFTATNKVVVGFVRQDGSDYHTEIIYATNRELEAISGVSCLEERGTKTVNGTVAGFGAGQIAVVGMGFASAPLQSANTLYSLTNLPERPLDLVASRQNLTSGGRSADRIVMRRTQSFVNNGTVPVIDFSTLGGEAVQAASTNATVSGILTNEFAYLQNNFFSQLETSHSLSYVEDITNASYAFASLPTASLAAGEYHDLILLSVDDGIGSVRGAENFFRAPSNQTLALGPTLAPPVVSVLPHIPYVRLRMQLPAQASYDDVVSVAYLQQLQFSVTTVSVTLTFGYVRRVIGDWTLDIPNLSGAEGWQDAWGLKTGSNIDWTVTALGGRAELLFGARPNDGEFARYATRQSQTPALSALEPGGLVRPGSLRRRR